MVEIQIIFKKVEKTVRPFRFYFYNNYCSSNRHPRIDEIYDFCLSLPKSWIDYTPFRYFSQRYYIHNRANYFNTWPYIEFKYEKDAIAFKLLFV